MWRFLYDNVAGTSHRDGGVACQDFAAASPLAIGGEDAIVLTCADGAGSAAFGGVGAEAACAEMLSCASRYLESGLSFEAIDEATVRDWLRSVHEALVTLATARHALPRDLACTLVVAILGETGSVFAQVGDGAIVVGDVTSGSLRAVTWPQTGEYQNTTHFITDEQYQSRAVLRLAAPPVVDVALFTDGLQMLTLDYLRKEPHAPFFRPLFRALRAADDWHELAVPLRQLLDSPGVNGRTDDDKTLMLASRMIRADPVA